MTGSDASQGSMRFQVRVGRSTERSVVRAVIGGLVCAALSATGFYVAFGGGEQVAGMAFLPDAWNHVLGRVVMGAGAVVTAALAGYAFHDARRIRRSR